MKITNDVLYILNKLAEAGYEGYIVGGCVRDSIMGIPPHDYDITTNALPDEIKKIFRRTVDTGIKHGTVTVLIDKTGYEVTTYRIDGEYGDFRHPSSVEFTGDIIKDLSRRDFTMNAIAYNPQKGYADPFFGRQDIEQKIIRGVREPDLRFKEDALRMLRCIRFSAQLGFDIEPQTYKALTQNCSLIQNVSIERITAEFLKLITAPYNEKILLFRESGLSDYCGEGLKKALSKREKEIAYLFGKIKKDEISALAVIFAEEKDAYDILKSLRLSNDIIRETMKLIKYYNSDVFCDIFTMRKILSEIGTESFLRLIDIKEAKNEGRINEAKLFISSEQRITKKDININGNDLLILGFKGMEIGKTIDRLLDFVFENPKNNTKEALTREALKWLH